MIETLKILEAVDKFYAQAFSNLITITIALLTILGVVLPLLYTVYQKRLFKLDHLEIETSLQKQLDLLVKKELEVLRTELENREALFEKKIVDIENQTKKKVSFSTAGVSHVQANMALTKKAYMSAFSSLIQAISSYIEAENDPNLQRVIKILHQDCIPKLDYNDFDTFFGIEGEFEKMLDKLNKYNSKNIYSDSIRLINIAFVQMKKRANEEKE